MRKQIGRWQADFDPVQQGLVVELLDVTPIPPGPKWRRVKPHQVAFLLSREETLGLIEVLTRWANKEGLENGEQISDTRYIHG